MREKLSSIFLSPEVFIELFIELFLLIVLSFTLIQSFFILKNYQFGLTSQLQYSLEKKSYLLGVAISISLTIKIVLVAFFTYSLDQLSTIVPGAMCAAGVLSSNEYGEILLALKLFILFLSSMWLLLNRVDTNSKDKKYFKKKIWFFVVLYFLIQIEFLLSLEFYSFIETQNPVLCCSSIFKESTNPLPFNLNSLSLVSLFYILYFMLIYSAYKKQKVALFLLSSAFIYISYYALIYFFGAYIYELPTHKCPFCMLQKDYNYIGYLIYITIFLAIFYTYAVIFFNFMNTSYKKIILFYTLFVLVLSSYFLLYLFKNGVLLF
jgi:hypothetical protein